MCGMNLDFDKMGGLVTAVIQDHASGRVLVVKMRANEVNRYTDYKKFRAESTIKIVQ